MCTQRPKHCVHMGIHLQEHRVCMYTHIPECCLPVYAGRPCIYIHTSKSIVYVYTLPRVHVYTHPRALCIPLCIHTHPRTLYMHVCICTYQIIRRTCVYARTPEHCICTCTHCRLLFKLVYIHQGSVFIRLHACTHVHTHILK